MSKVCLEENAFSHWSQIIVTILRLFCKDTFISSFRRSSSSTFSANLFGLIDCLFLNPSVDGVRGLHSCFGIIFSFLEDFCSCNRTWFLKEASLTYCLPIKNSYFLHWKVVLWCFFTSETSEKSTIQLFESKSQYIM